MQAFLAHRPQDAFGRHRYDPADFRWTYAGLASEFRDYIERYHIETAEPEAELLKQPAGLSMMSVCREIPPPGW